MSRRLHLAASACAAMLLVATGPPAQSQPPPRDLTVTVRLVEGVDPDPGLAAGATRQPASTTGNAISSRSGPTDLPQSQTLRILSGTQARVHFSRALPTGWVAAVSGRPPFGSTSAGAGNDGVVNAVSWQHAGYDLSIQPVWPGGGAPATVHIELGIAHVDDKVGTEIPASSNERVTTTVVTTLGQWTTFAVRGPGSDPGDRHSWSSGPTSSRQTQRFQIKVSRPAF